MQVLADAGCNLFLTNVQKETAADCATKHGHHEIAALLEAKVVFTVSFAPCPVGLGHPPPLSLSSPAPSSLTHRLPGQGPPWLGLQWEWWTKTFAPCKISSSLRLTSF